MSFTDPQNPAPDAGAQAPAQDVPPAATVPPVEPAQDVPPVEQAAPPAEDARAIERAEFEDLQRRLAEAEDRAEQAEAQASKPTPVAAPVSTDLAGLSQDERSAEYDGWPWKGGNANLPQPWDLRAQNLHRDSQDLADQAAGASDTVSPVVVLHSRPILTSGSTDDVVYDIGNRLAELGFENSVSRGTNPFGMVDESIMAAVYAFRQAYGVEEDPSPFGGATPAGIAAAANHIGPWTHEAIVRATSR